MSGPVTLSLEVNTDDMPAGWKGEDVRRVVHEALSIAGLDVVEVPNVKPSTLVLLNTLVNELAKVCAPITSKDAADYSERYEEHHRAIGASVTIAAMVARELGGEEIHARAMALILRPRS